MQFEYAAEGDRVNYPLGRDTRIEGGHDSSGDKHAMIGVRGKASFSEASYSPRAQAIL